MEDFTREELIQILNFYKNKSVDLELSYLTLQINNNKIINENKAEFEKKIKDRSDVHEKLSKDMVDSHRESVNFLKKEIDKKNKEIEKLKNLKNKK
jgi:hypothetical protein